MTTLFLCLSRTQGGMNETTRWGVFKDITRMAVNAGLVENKPITCMHEKRLTPLTVTVGEMDALSMDD